MRKDCSKLTEDQKPGGTGIRRVDAQAVEQLLTARIAAASETCTGLCNSDATGTCSPPKTSRAGVGLRYQVHQGAQTDVRPRQSRKSIAALFLVLSMTCLGSSPPCL